MVLLFSFCYDVESLWNEKIWGAGGSVAYALHQKRIIVADKPKNNLILTFKNPLQ